MGYSILKANLETLQEQNVHVDKLDRSALKKQIENLLHLEEKYFATSKALRLHLPIN